MQATRGAATIPQASTIARLARRATVCLALYAVELQICLSSLVSGVQKLDVAGGLE